MAHATVKAWYGSGRWKARRAQQLRSHPHCAQPGCKAAATVADHIKPHRGDEQSFWFGELQSLCATHHNSGKQFAENRGYDKAIGLDGMPLDPRHPCYK